MGGHIGCGLLVVANPAVSGTVRFVFTSHAESTKLNCLSLEIHSAYGPRPVSPPGAEGKRVRKHDAREQMPAEGLVAVDPDGAVVECAAELSPVAEGGGQTDRGRSADDGIGVRLDFVTYIDAVALEPHTELVAAVVVAQCHLELSGPAGRTRAVVGADGE